MNSLHRNLRFINCVSRQRSMSNSETGLNSSHRSLLNTKPSSELSARSCTSHLAGFRYKQSPVRIGIAWMKIFYYAAMKAKNAIIVNSRNLFPTGNLCTKFDWHFVLSERKKRAQSAVKMKLNLKSARWTFLVRGRIYLFSNNLKDNRS